MNQIIIEHIQKHEIDSAAELLSRAFIRTQFASHIMGGQGEKQRKNMQMGFMMMLKKAPGQVMVAKDGDEIVGVMRMAEWPDCQKSTPHGIALLPLFLILRGAAYRLWKFRKIWGIHDPKKPHWHIDPLGVLPDRQGQGIGSQLLNYFCEHVDGLNMPAYHETDQEQNVRLYERFGYKVIETEEVFSVTNWFLWRDPQ